MTLRSSLQKATLWLFGFKSTRRYHFAYACCFYAYDLGWQQDMGSNGRNGNLEAIPFGLDDSSNGFMVFPGAPPSAITVERSDKNDHLFLYNNRSERFETLRYGSALIVSMLRMYEPEPSSLPPKLKTITNTRKLALFDNDGHFYDQLSLSKPVFPREIDSGTPDIRHTAFFDRATDGGNNRPFTIAIDEIFMLSLAKPADIDPADFIKNPA